MSYRDRDRYSSSSRDRDRRSSPPRHRRRSPSPGPSRGRSPQRPRDPKSLPESFGRIPESVTDDDLSVLQRMKTTYKSSPLEFLYNYVRENRKVKVWTRNFKEVRGVMTGYIIAFDKHWNLIIRDVDEAYLKLKKSKTPFLRDVEADENLQDIPAKVPKVKRAETAPAAATESVESKSEKDGSKKKRKKKKKKTDSFRRQIDSVFIRGDNIVMVSPVESDAEGEVVEEEELMRQSG